ncbi:MAG: hypothetical protein RLP44_32040 [Aggregatilineales bacterium]
MPDIKNHLYDDDILIVSKPLARAFGLSASIILRRLAHWLRRNQEIEERFEEGTRRHFKDDRWWAYNTYEQWSNDVGGIIAPRTIRTIFGSFEDLGIVASSSDYNKLKIDNTKWYTIDFDIYEAAMSHWYESDCPQYGSRPADPNYQQFLESFQAIRTNPPSVHDGHTSAHDGQMDASMTDSPAPVHDGQAITSINNAKHKETDSSQKTGTASSRQARNRPHGLPQGKPTPEDSGIPSVEARGIVTFIEARGGHALPKKLASKLEEGITLGLENGSTEIHESPADQYDENSAYRKWVALKVDYYLDQAHNSATQFKNKHRQLVNMLRKLNAPGVGFFSFLHNEGANAYDAGEGVQQGESFDPSDLIGGTWDDD